jgi:hypothetical protein
VDAEEMLFKAERNGQLPHGELKRRIDHGLFARNTTALTWKGREKHTKKNCAASQSLVQDSNENRRTAAIAAEVH